MAFNQETNNLQFEVIRLRLASPDDIHNWSHGEVTKPETINYRTQKPEKDGLFCERIFGPVKDWECYCGKYKKIRYKGIVCDKCGVEVTRSIVRRERMGHIDLAAPVSHIWFLRGVPSRIGLALDLSVQSLEKVVYFASFIITKVNEELKKQTLEQIKTEYKQYRKQIENDYNRKIEKYKADNKEAKDSDPAIVEIIRHKEEKLGELENTMTFAESEIKDLKPLKIISEHTFHDLSLKYGHVFEANTGAESVRELLANIDLDKTVKELESQIESATGAKRDKLIRRAKFFNQLIKNNIRPEWMILTTVPVIPPDLRPMVPLDGGRFATSDLNDLYRRVINRNNRLKQLLDLNAPEVITRNEKRMLQEAVDALIDNNARHGKTVVASTGQKRMLKSIADMLKGKQGRFRQNLLGKRIDYSGRSVIVVGPQLKIDECGLPKIMALELFKPFIISKLIKRGTVHNVRSANRYIEAGHDDIWDILEEVVKGAYVLLNRAPTLHRLGIQAFKPILIEGKAIQIHPLVCSAFNADFDGDQMAVHVPLTAGAVKEAAELMLSRHNLLKPAHGQPIVTPNQDIVWGCYYLTTVKEPAAIKYFSSVNEAFLAKDRGLIGIQDKIKILFKKSPKSQEELLETTLGAILFNSILPPDYQFINYRVGKKELGRILGDILRQFGPETTVDLLDNLKVLGFKYLTNSAQSLGMDDLKNVAGREELVAKGNQELDSIEQQYQIGLLTDDERHEKIVEMWLGINNEILSRVKGALEEGNSVLSMIDSGARGSWGQLSQMIGMKGPVVNPAYEVIELPVKGNFKKGFDVLEFFISTHGARKGLTDTALRTSSAGYLTRRLVDVAQDMVVNAEDCKDKEGLLVTKEESEIMGENLVDRIIGRYAAQDITHPQNGKVLVAAGEIITEEVGQKLKEADIAQAVIRSALTCKNIRGVCQKCYGYDLAYNQPVKIGTAVGIIAAQSVGEPGTQLTMRTFHTGGVASEGDITQGLPRVEEIFEARSPKIKAIVADVAGVAHIKEGKREIKDQSGKTIITSGKQRILEIAYDQEAKNKINFPGGKQEVKLAVKDGQAVKVGQVLFTVGSEEKAVSNIDGQVKIEKDGVLLIGQELAIKEFIVPSVRSLMIKDGDKVEIGDQLTEGSLDLHQIYRLKGQEFTQKYIMREIQHIYSSQGQKLNDKHVEVIVRQIFSKVYIKESGDSDFMPGEVVEYVDVMEANRQLKKDKKQLAEFERLLLGITKVSLSTRSWLAAASFQETAKVLIDAAMTGKADDLSGLKENIIIGRLIPAGTGFHKARKK